MPRKEFTVHILNDDGLAKANKLAEAFSTLLDTIEELVPATSRERALAVTHLEEASFFAKRAMASDHANHAVAVSPSTES